MEDNYELNDRIRIGRRIEDLRKQAGLSQRDLAARCGIAQSTIYRIEAGKFAVRLDLLESIANVLGKKVDLV
jgi:transcriptional regulator with XRE-family HTH domain